MSQLGRSTDLDGLLVRDCRGDLLLEDLVDGQVDLYLTLAGDFLLKVMERGRSSVPAWPVNRFRWTTCK